MAIGISATVGKDVIGLDVGTAAFLVSIFAIFNGIGRPIFGTLADKIRPKYAAIITFVIIGISSLMMLSAGQSSVTLFAVTFCGFWHTLGVVGSVSALLQLHPSSVLMVTHRSTASFSAHMALAPSSAVSYPVWQRTLLEVIPQHSGQHCTCYSWHHIRLCSLETTKKGIRIQFYRLLYKEKRRVTTLSPFFFYALQSKTTSHPDCRIFNTYTKLHSKAH